VAERNLIKNRLCKLCGDWVLGKASKLKTHAKECKKTHADAAAEAIMQAMQEEMTANEDGSYGKSVIEEASEIVRMADERVLNAEGD